MNQTTQPRKCAFLQCADQVKPPHELCWRHWLQRFDRLIIRCPWCRMYQEKEVEECESCRQTESQTKSKGRSRKKTAH